MDEGCGGRKSSIDSNNNVWTIHKKVGIMLIRRYGQYITIEVTRGDIIYNYNITCVCVSGIEWSQ